MITYFSNLFVACNDKKLLHNSQTVLSQARIDFVSYILIIMHKVVEKL